MPNGFRGWGFGFRGSSPPWPFIGIGRGGLPRCGYFLSGASGMPVPPYYPYYGGAYPGAMPYSGSPQMSREQELDFLRSQAESLKNQLEQIGSRLKELEAEEEL